MDKAIVTSLSDFDPKAYMIRIIICKDSDKKPVFNIGIESLDRIPGWANRREVMFALREQSEKEKIVVVINDRTFISEYHTVPKAVRITQFAPLRFNFSRTTDIESHNSNCDKIAGIDISKIMSGHTFSEFFSLRKFGNVSGHDIVLCCTKPGEDRNGDGEDSLVSFFLAPVVIKKYKTGVAFNYPDPSTLFNNGPPKWAVRYFDNNNEAGQRQAIPMGSSCGIPEEIASKMS